MAIYVQNADSNYVIITAEYSTELRSYLIKAVTGATKPHR